MTRPVDRERWVKAYVSIRGDNLTDEEAIAVAQLFDGYQLPAALTARIDKPVMLRIHVSDSLEDEPDWMDEDEPEEDPDAPAPPTP